MWLNMITILNLERAAPYKEDAMQTGPRNKTFKKKRLVKNTILFLFLLVVDQRLTKGNQKAKESVITVLLTRGSMRTVLQVS